MKLHHFIFALYLILTPVDVFGQTNSLAADFSKDAGLYDPRVPAIDKINSSSRPIFSWLGEQPDVSFIVHESQPCPPGYVLSITNTNLFSVADQTFLQDIWRKYRIPNSNVSDSFRTKSGDGYDVSFSLEGKWHRWHTLKNGTEHYETFTNEWTLDVQQVKHNQLNGPRVEFYGPHGGSLLHFSDDKAVGEWFEWDPAGNLRLEAKFNQPYDFFTHLKMIK